MLQATGGKRATAANRFGLDYRLEAERLGPPVVPIVDIHSHIHGPTATRVYEQARRMYGVVTTYSMTQLVHAAGVREILGDSVRFIAIPNWGDADRARAHGEGYLETIERFRREFGARMLKIWASPRLRDLIPAAEGVAGSGGGGGATGLWEIDAPARVRACELGRDLGMMYMVHVADPDTWFATKYTDVAKYGTKRDQYAGLERMLDRFTAPWIAAHFGGWPEDLAFLDGMLSRHPNLYLDTSATKWMIRELSRHPREAMVGFLTKWRGRVLFGSDIVATEDHLRPQTAATTPMSDLADSPEAALDLYASRYWALRTFFETGYNAESAIADPDLMMVEPATHDAMSAPVLRGLSLPREMLAELYSGAAAAVVGAWEQAHP